MVTFDQIPASLRVPVFAAEFDSSRAQQGPAIQPWHILVVGQRLAAGSVAELVPTLVTSVDDAGAYFGRGSMLHGMARTLFLNNRLTRAIFVALDDAGGGAQASGTFTVTGMATKAGTLFVYVAGRRFLVPVSSGDDPTTVAASIESEINGSDEVPVTAAAVAGVVTCTAKNAGEAGKDIQLELNFFEGEFFPEGVSVAATAMGGGSGNPDVTPIWAAIGTDTQYNAVAFPYDDSANLTAFLTEAVQRDDALSAVAMRALIGIRGTHAALVTQGTGQDSRYLSFMGSDSSPTPPYEWASAIAGVVAGSAQSDPAVPFQRKTLLGVLPPKEEKRFTLQERDILLHSAVATFNVRGSGEVLIERLITTYQTNVAGAPDTAFLDLNTGLTLDYLRFDFTSRMALAFPQHKLADDGVRVGPGQRIVTPLTARAQALSIFRAWEVAGLVEGFEQFESELVVVRSQTDPNRLEFVLPTDLVNQLRIGAAKFQFLL